MHGPIIMAEEDGVFRRKRTEGGGRDKDSTAAKITAQTKLHVSDVSKTDQRDNKDAKYNLKGPFKKVQLITKINHPILQYQLWLCRHLL